MFERVDARAAQGPQQKQAGGAGARTSYQALLAADEAWAALRNMKTGAAAGPAPEFVRQHPRGSVTTAAGAGGSRGGGAAGGGPCEFDVVVAGGTLGVFHAAALARRGWRVAVVERGPLAGRAQEWNISRKELHELVEAGLLDEREVEGVVALEFNPVRVGFHGGADLWVRDVLNLGVKPDALVQLMRSKLEAAGGKVFERVQITGVDVYPDGVAVGISGQTPAGPGASAAGAAAAAAEPGAAAAGGGLQSGARVQYTSRITTRLVVDCMGHQSPIVRQLRWGKKPDGVCLVVGGCARGFDPEANTTADVIYTAADMAPPGAAASPPSAQQQQQQRQQEQEQLQFFWEAFPAADGLLQQGPGSARGGAAAAAAAAGQQPWRSDARTTYLFTYLDAQPCRPSLHRLFEDYWRLMPQYQGLGARGGELEAVERLEWLRLLFGVFPTFKDSPLRPGFDRVLQVGDASGIQSPLSFGGFGALSRHLGRLTAAVGDALSCDALGRGDLALVNAYNPGLSSAWMLQRAMVGSRGPGAPGGAPPNLINKMLSGNFAAMTDMGEPVLKPFLQDVIQFAPLMRTMGAQVVQDPLFVPQLMAHVGPLALADWLGHVGALGAYTALHAAAAPPLRLLAGSGALPARAAFRLGRALDAWEYGSGADFKP